MKISQFGVTIYFSSLLLSQAVFATPNQPVITQVNPNHPTAFQAIAEAELLAQQGTAVAKRQAIDKYLEAVQGYKNLPISEASVREIRLQLATILKKIGGLYQSLGESEQALVYYNQALPIFTELGEVVLQAKTWRDLGMLYNVFGERQKVLDSLETAQQLYQQAGDAAGVGSTLSNIGWIHYFFLCAREKGIELYEQALKVYQKAGNRYGESNILSQIAWGYYGLGNYEKALNYYKQAIEVARKAGYKSGEAHASIYISQVYHCVAFVL